AGIDDHPLELRCGAHELEVLRRGAVTHYTLDARPVVPGAVEEDDLTGSGQVYDVALEVPLRLLALCRDSEGDRAGATRVEVLVEALDGSTLASGITTLEDDGDLLAGGLDL